MDENNESTQEVISTQTTSAAEGDQPIVTPLEQPASESIHDRSAANTSELSESSGTIQGSSDADAESISTNTQSNIAVPQSGDGVSSEASGIGSADSTRGSTESNTAKTNKEASQQAAKQQAKRFFYRKPAIPPGSQNAGNSKPSFFRRLKPAHYIAAGMVIAGAAIIGLTAPRVQAPAIPSITPTPASVVIASNSAQLQPTELPIVYTVHRGVASLYPNGSLTPGAILPVTKQQVCQPDYTSSVRDVTDTTKNEVFAEYGITYHPAGAYEIDHFVSLELGGSNDITNLWPEPALPVPGFHQKDLVEDYLHKQVCSGRITLQQAQQEISTDWYAVYLQMK